MYAIFTPTGTVSAPSSNFNITTFGPSSTRIAPIAGTYSSGYLPGQGFPAENENYLMYHFSNAINQITYDLYNIHSEILTVLSSASITTNDSTTQLNQAIGSKITTALVPYNGVSGFTASNSSGATNVPKNNGTLNVNLVAQYLGITTTLYNLAQSGTNYIPYVDVSGKLWIGGNAGTGGVLAIKAPASGFVMTAQKNGGAGLIYGLYENASNGGEIALYDTATSVKVQISSAGTTYFNGGNVLIGTTTDAARLTVQGAGNAFPATTGTTQSAGLISRLNSTTNVVLDIGLNGGNGVWLQVADKCDYSTNYPLMINPNGGNVLIGTDVDAGYKLNVNGLINGIGHIRSVASNLSNVFDSGLFVSSYINAANGTYTFGGIFADTFRDVAAPCYSAGMWFESRTVGGVQSDSDILFGASYPITGYNNRPTERMRITSGGNVLIARSADDNTGAVLQVNGGISGTLGTAVAGSAIITSGVLGTTQGIGDNSQKIATTAYAVQRSAIRATLTSYSTNFSTTQDLHIADMQVGEIVRIIINNPTNTSGSPKNWGLRTPSTAMRTYTVSGFSLSWTGASGTPVQVYESGVGSTTPNAFFLNQVVPAGYNVSGTFVIERVT